MIKLTIKNFCHWSIMVASRPFLVELLKGDWDPECFQDNKNFITVIYRISEFHSLFVCKVSVGSDW